MTDKELMQHFKNLYESSIDVIEELLSQVNVFDTTGNENNRAEAKQLVKEQLKRKKYDI